MIKIVFLGTSQAVPDRERGQTSVLLNYDGENILVDCGECTQRQFRLAGLNPCKLDKILITHWHGDHVLGLPGLLQTLALNNYSKVLEIYGPKGTKKYLQIMRKMFAFKGKIKIETKEVERGIFFENKKFFLEAAEMDHTTKCLAYAFVEKDKRKVKMEELRKIGIEEGPWIKKLQEGEDLFYEGKKISALDYTTIEKGKKISFIFDTRFNKNCVKIAKDSDVLVAEACFLKRDKKLALERGHLTAEDASKIAKKAKVKKLILTHVSQRYLKKEEVVKEAKKIFPYTELARDFMTIYL
ncbi:MAG: ribonuclease Z [Candidatus Pacearchaeota archaeon]|nr:ribonuclease Z [Candidatus Pacearchaeota archaeon]